MQEAWIELVCPGCAEQWEANPADLPAPGEPFACPYCETEARTSEFPRTTRDLEVLGEFHEN